MSITVICPSRGRPAKASEAYASFVSTKTERDTRMVFVVDIDDETRSQYVEEGLTVHSWPHAGGMGAALNAAAMALVDTCTVLGFVGDDHRFRTKGWDASFEKLFAEKKGIAYGNDLARNDIPTQVFISSEIVAALGWMALPGATHLYLDDTWAELGKRANCFYYAPSIIIEHVHAFYGKSEMDEGYERVNHPTVYQHDHDVFWEWKNNQAEQDIAKVRMVL